jgi:hypothetical protein
MLVTENDPAYQAATRPRTSSVEQRPARVAVIARPADIPVALAEVDRDAIWTFRGAGGVGIAHTLAFDLAPAPDLHAGALLWPAALLPELVPAWTGALPALGCEWRG